MDMSHVTEALTTLVVKWRDEVEKSNPQQARADEWLRGYNKSRISAANELDALAESLAAVHNSAVREEQARADQTSYLTPSQRKQLADMRERAEFEYENARIGGMHPDILRQLKPAFMVAEEKAQKAADRELDTDYVEYGFREKATGKITWWGKKNYLAGLTPETTPEGWSVVKRAVGIWEVVE